MGFLGLGLRIVKAGFLIDVKRITVVRFGVGTPSNLEISGLREGGWLSRLEADEALSRYGTHDRNHAEALAEIVMARKNAKQMEKI